MNKPKDDSVLDDGAVDENKGKLELVYWKNLCDVIIKEIIFIKRLKTNTIVGYLNRWQIEKYKIKLKDKKNYKNSKKKLRMKNFEFNTHLY